MNFASPTIILGVFKSSATAQEELVCKQRRRLSPRLPLCQLIALELTTSHIHTRGGAAWPQPIIDTRRRSIEPAKNRESQFLSSFLATVFIFGGAAAGGGGGYLSNLFGDQLSTFLAPSCQFFGRQLPVFFLSLIAVRLDDMAVNWHSIIVCPGYQYQNKKTTWIY